MSVPVVAKCDEEAKELMGRDMDCGDADEDMTGSLRVAIESSEESCEGQRRGTQAVCELWLVDIITLSTVLITNESKVMGDQP